MSGLLVPSLVQERAAAEALRVLTEGLAHQSDPPADLANAATALSPKWEYSCMSEVCSKLVSEAVGPREQMSSA